MHEDSTSGAQAAIRLSHCLLRRWRQSDLVEHCEVLPIERNVPQLKTIAALTTAMPNAKAAPPQNVARFVVLRPSRRLC